MDGGQDLSSMIVFFACQSVSAVQQDQSISAQAVCRERAHARARTQTHAAGMCCSGGVLG